VNGIALKDTEPFLLRPNDRIMLGPSAAFLFKDERNKDKASKPDTEEDPITYDDFFNEYEEIENAE